MIQDSIENYIKEYPNQEQVKMMKTWLKRLLWRLLPFLTCG